MGFVSEGLIAAQPLRRLAISFAAGQLEGECEKMSGRHSVLGFAITCRKGFMHFSFYIRKCL